MKFFRYKQACRLTFNGLDDELNNVASSYYITKYKLLNNTEINTKLLRFRIENLRDVKLSQNAKLILESFSIPAILDETNEIKHTGNIILKLKNISDSKCYDSSNNNNSSPILFLGSVQSTAQTYVDINTVSTTLATTLIPAVSTYNNSVQKELMYNGSLNFINPSPDKLFNFTIPNTFTNTTVFEFELIYDMNVGENIVMADDATDFFNFKCSLIIQDEDEEDLTSNDSNTVDFDKFKPHFPLKKSH